MIMINFILIPIFSLLNALRGGAHISRPTCAFGMGLSVFILKYFQVSLEQSIIMGFIVFLGMWFGLVLGWGKYLNILSGNMQYVHEDEIKPIDWVANTICGFSQNSDQFIRWCFVAMSLRGALFYPVFIALSYYNHNALVFGLGSILMGFVYCLARLAPIGTQVRASELMYGALLGLLISLSV